MRRTKPAVGGVDGGQGPLSLETRVTSAARALGVTLSRVAEEESAQAVKLERNRRWTQENRGAPEACAREVDREGVALARHRTF